MSSVLKGIPCTAVAFVDISTIAKSEHARLYGSPGEPEDIQRLRAEAADEARTMIGEALVQADAIREEARQEGLRQGQQEGRTLGLESAAMEIENERESLRQVLQLLVERIEFERQEMWKSAEGQVLEFALAMTRKVLTEECSINRDAALSVIKRSLPRVLDRENIRIRVNEADIETVKMNRQDLLALLDGVRNLEITADRRVGVGGAVIETGGPSIDARVETQLDEMETAIRSELMEAA